MKIICIIIISVLVLTDVNIKFFIRKNKKWILKLRTRLIVRLRIFQIFGWYCSKGGNNLKLNRLNFWVKATNILIFIDILITTFEVTINWKNYDFISFNWFFFTIFKWSLKIFYINLKNIYVVSAVAQAFDLNKAHQVLVQ